MIVLGLDGGGTKTEAVVMEQGVVRGRGVGGPANPRFSPESEAEGSLRDAVGEALRASGADPAAVARMVFGGPVSGRAVARLAADMLPYAAVHHASEGDMTLRAARVSGAGIAVVAGTGSLVMVRTPAGDRVTVGGWGSIIGDQGSAYDIARKALRAAAQAVDGWGPSTSLVESIQAWANVSTFREVLEVVYRPETSRRDIAAVARRVSDAALSGDAVARAILDHAGRDLACQVEGALARAADWPPSWPLACAGGVLQAGGPVLESLLATLDRHHVQPMPLTMTLAEGAATIAASGDVPRTSG